MARVLLIVPSATYKAPDFLEAARRMGVDVVVGSPERHVLAGVMGDHSLTLPLEDPEAAVEAIVSHDGRLPIDAVVAVDDAGAVAAALASQRLGLAHNPADAVAATRDKAEMRRRFAVAEVPQPPFATIGPELAGHDVTRVTDGIGYPCVIKPTTLSASQGVIRADGPEEAVGVLSRVRSIAADAGVAGRTPVIVERFVPGAELAVEAILDGGELETLAVFDKPDPLDGPYFEETIYVTPSRLSRTDLDSALAAVSSATAALGLVTGPVHAEVRVRDGRCAIVEVAARTIGGLCSRALYFGSGRSLEELVLANSLGMRQNDDGASHGSSGVLMLPIPRAGVLVGVEGKDRALEVEGIVGVETTIPPGHTVVPVPEGNRYLGFVFARGERPEDVERALRAAQSEIYVRVEPSPS